MSSNATGDVPPDTTAGTGSVAPAEAAEAAQLAPPAAQAEAPALKPAPDAPELTEDNDDPAGTDDPGSAADDGEPAEPAGEYDEDEEYEEYEPAGLSDAPIDMSESVELAEPVEEAEPGRRGHAVLLTVGFVLAALAIVGGAIAIVGSLTHGFKKPVTVTYTKSAIFSLRTGQCIDPHGQSASVLPCDTPHDAEVFATFTLPDSKWPGDSAVQTAASSGCSTRLTAYINPQLAISLASTYVYPNAVAWQAGTRTVICEVTAASGQLTGSVRGATATAG
jgi:hypothetical protein